jgi:hypothetical protein
MHQRIKVISLRKKVPHIFIPSGFFGPDGLKSNWLNLPRFKGL